MAPAHDLRGHVVAQSPPIPETRCNDGHTQSRAAIQNTPTVRLGKDGVPTFFPKTG